MAQITQEHESLFKSLLGTVDNAGARSVFSHLWDVLRETIGVVTPVVEAAVPEAKPVLDVAAMGAEELQTLLAQLQQALAAKQQPAEEPASRAG